MQAEVLDLLRDLQKRLGLGILLVTHNFGVVADLCDRVAVMQGGRLVESGDVRSVLRSPEEDYTKMLLAAMLEGKKPMTPLSGAHETPAGFDGVDSAILGVDTSNTSELAEGVQAS